MIDALRAFSAGKRAAARSFPADFSRVEIAFAGEAAHAIFTR